MAKLVGVFWLFTVLLFLPFLLYGYAGAPDLLSLGFGHSDQEVISKGTFFYLAVGLFFMANISMYLAAKLIKLRFPKRQLFYYLRQWLRSFAGISNIFLTFLLLFISMSNSTESFNLSRYKFLVYVGPILLIAWLVLLVVIFIRQGRREPVV